MHFFALLAFMAFAITVCAVPITPAAPELQARAEQFRLLGLREHEIAEKLMLPPTTSADEDSAEEVMPFFAILGTKINALLHDCNDDDDHDHDISGDIAPGSLDAPQMLPRPTPLKSAGAWDRLVSYLRKEDSEKNYAYEGKELELRRPTGMRHWGAAGQDKWRLF